MHYLNTNTRSIYALLCNTLNNTLQIHMTDVYFQLNENDNTK